MKPYSHSVSSVKKFGGKYTDYMPIHMFMDSSKGACADNRHRCLLHQNWSIMNIMERIKFPNSGPEINCTFPTIINSDGKSVSVRDVCEQHVCEDLSCIPTVDDYMSHMDISGWMMNKGKPNSFKRLREKKVKPVDPAAITFNGTRKQFKSLPPEVKNKVLEVAQSNPIIVEHYNKVAEEEFPTDTRSWPTIEEYQKD